MIRPLILLLILTFAKCHSATVEPSHDQIAAFSNSIAMVFSDSFVAAYDIVGDMTDTVPGKPIYHLLCAAVAHAEMLDAEDFSRERVFFGHVDTSVDLLEKWEKENPDDAWGQFFLGTAHGYKSVLYAQKKSWLKSLVAGLKAKGKFKKAIEIDPALYDAYTGMGNYHYWSTVKLGKYIPFLPNNRDKGILELKLAVDSSLFSSLPARAGLAWALIQEKEYKQAIEIGRRMEEETGGGRNSLWILGGAYWRTGNLNLAADYYSRLIDSFNATGNQNYYNLIFCGYRRGVCYFKMGRLKEAMRDFETILSYETSKKVKKRHKETFERTEDYLGKIEKIFKDKEKSL